MNKTIVQILKNTATSWGAVGLQAVIGLVMIPFLLGKMGKDGFGAIAILMSIIGFSQVADLGLRQALNRELAEKVAEKDIDGFRRLSSSALVLYIVIALCVGGLGAIFAPSLCSIFKVGDDYFGVMTLLLRTYAPFSILLSFVIPVFSAGVCSSMRYDVQNNITIATQIFVSLMLFLCLSFIDANPLIVWCGVRAAGDLIRLVMMGFFYRRICDGGQLSARFVNWPSLVPLFKLGGSMYILQLTFVLSQRMDPLIISRFIGLSGVALYEAGSKLLQMVNPVVLAAVSQLTPLTTKYHVGDNQKREQQVLILGTKYTLYLGIIFSVGMFLFADLFCHLWLFNKLGESVKTVALVVKMWAVISLFKYAGGPQWSIVLGKKKMKFSLWLGVTTAIFNVLLSIYLVGYTTLGVAGVLVGTLVTEIVRRPIAAWYVSHILGLKLYQYFVHAYMIPIVYLTLLFFLGRMVVFLGDIEGWVGLIVAGLIIGCSGVVLVLIFEWRMVRTCLMHFNNRSADNHA